MAKTGERRVCLGAIAGAHGVRGLVKIKSFTEVPEDLAAYGPLTDADGERRFEIRLTGGRTRDLLLGEIAGIADRDRAEALRGQRLYVERAALPEPEPETFYHADLVGLRAEDRSGRVLGRVAAVDNFGAGDILEIVPDEESKGSAPLMLPFTRAAVPEVDLEAGRLVVEPPAETVAGPEGETAERRPAPERDDLDKERGGRHKAPLRGERS